MNESILIIENIEDIQVSDFFENLNFKLKNFSSEISKFFKDKDLNVIDILKDDISIPKWPLYVFMLSAIFCLGSSALFHWFMAHSEKYFNLLNRLDYAGISILIAGSCYPPYFYFFYYSECKILKIFLNF